MYNVSGYESGCCGFDLGLGFEDEPFSPSLALTFFAALLIMLGIELELARLLVDAPSMHW